MSRPGKDKVNFTDGGIITQEAMLAYLGNKMSAEDKQQFEKLLADDPFAQEALEGLQSSRHAEALLNTMQGIKKNIREKSGVKERKVISINVIQYAAAAVTFGLLIGIGFLMFYFIGKKDDQLAQNENAPAKVDILNEEKIEAPQTTTIVADSMALNNAGYVMMDSTLLSRADNKPVAVAPAEAKEDMNPKYRVESATQEDAREQVKNVNAIPASPGSAANHTVIANSDGTVSTNGRKTNSNTYSWDDAKDKAAESKNLESVTIASKKAPAAAQRQEAEKPAKEAVSIEDARSKFNAGDYKASGEDFDQVLKSDPNNADALYFGGVSDYIQGKTSKSEKNFDKLLKQGTKHVDGAKWYKANILLKKGKTAEAKALLNDLANSNNSYKERAVKKLEEVK